MLPKASMDTVVVELPREVYIQLIEKLKKRVKTGENGLIQLEKIIERARKKGNRIEKLPKRYELYE